MESIDKKTLAQIVSLKPVAASVFEKYDLDFCCKGKRTLQEACEENRVSLDVVEQELEKIFNDHLLPEDHFDEMNPGDLIKYIISQHHHYVKDSMTMILAHLKKVALKHGEKNPELNTIFNLFTEVKEEMDQHMYKEENILFPRINEIHDALNSESFHWMPDKYYLSSPIGVMEEEHDKAGTLLHEIKLITGNYIPPDHACTTYRLCFDELREFELDLHRHVHLENNILFPRAQEMHERLRQILFN